MMAALLLRLCALSGVVALTATAQAADNVEPSTVKKVHLIQANHLDLGFSDLATRVMNRYLVGGPGTTDPDGGDAPNVYETFLGSAARTARTLKAAGQAPAMRYMADSWVLDVFRDCPTDFPSVGPPWDPSGLLCPNASLFAQVTEAVKQGDIWTHAFPHNAQPELMDAAMFAAAVNSSVRTATEMQSPHRPRVLSQRDVPGLTRSVIPHLKRLGALGISIGSNDGSPSPHTPSTAQCDTLGLHVVRTPFLWVDSLSNSSIVVDVHPGGYGGITGDYTPPGDSMDGSLCDCIGVVGLEEVLCYAWRGDNYGPAGVAEVREDFRLFGKLFPNADVVASTLGDYFGLIDGNETIRANLPTMEAEMGDTWIYGVQSDPMKVAQMRAIQRAYTAHLLAADDEAEDDDLRGFLHYTIKLFEHTWGGSTGAHMNISHETVSDVWTAAELAQARGSHSYIDKLEASWTEQRLYIDKAVKSLPTAAATAAESSGGSSRGRAAAALRTAIEREFATISAPPPTASSLKSLGYTPVASGEWGAEMELSSPNTATTSTAATTIKFDPATGAIIKLTTTSAATASSAGANSSSMPQDWASAENPIGRFGYRSHSYNEYHDYISTYTYAHGGQHPFSKGPPAPPNCTTMNNCHTLSKMWRAPIVGMWLLRTDQQTQKSQKQKAQQGQAPTPVASKVAVEMALPAAVRTQYGYGAPTTVWLLVSLPSQTPEQASSTHHEANAATGAGAGGLDLELELVWGGKAATRLYEGIYFEMHPALQQETVAAGNTATRPNAGIAGGGGSSGEGWRLLVDKIGRQVDSAAVVTHGGSAVHGFDPNGGVTFAAPPAATSSRTAGSDGRGVTSTRGTTEKSRNETAAGRVKAEELLSLHIDSLDGGLVMPAAAGNVWNFTAFFTPPTANNTDGVAPDPADGLSFNLMNNQYWTNYVLWYPWLKEDGVGRFRFRLCEMVVGTDGAMQSCGGKS